MSKGDRLASERGGKKIRRSWSYGGRMISVHPESSQFYQIPVPLDLIR